MKKYIPLAIVFACFFFGCSSKKKEKEKMVVSKTPGTIITDSIAPPKITRITEANAPKVIKAGPPKILPLSYPFGLGVPTITNYSVADGLSNNSIAASAIDRQGNIWFATLGGLSKYDGQDFTNYNSVNGMVSEFSRTLFIDSKNNVWIAEGNGLSIFDGKYFKRVFPDQDKSLRISTNKIFEDSRGVIWIATNNGLYQYKDNVFMKYTTADGLAGNWVTFLIQDKNGDLLITTNEGLNRFDGKSFSPYTEIPYSKKSRGTHFLFCDSKGNIWFNDGTGVLGKYDGKQITMYNQKERGMLLSSRSPITILEDINGNLWFGGWGELTKFDGKQFFNYAPKANPEFTFQLRSLTEDAYGNIWAGTQEEGVYKISNPMLTKMEMPVEWFRAVAIDKAGHIWIRSREGLGKFNGDHMALYWNEQLGSGAAALFIDHAGNKWFQSFDRNTQLMSIVRYNDTTFTIFGKAQWPSITTIRSIIEDDSNNIWFLGSNGVVAKFDGFSFTEFGPAQGLKAGEIFSIFQDSKRNIWFGSNDAGAFKYDGHHFVNYTTQDGLPHHFINSIAEDAFGNIWLGTDAGAAKFDGKTFTSYGEKQGLAKIVARLKYDSVNNAIWFDTYIGLASIKMEQVNVEKPIFQHYNSRTGFDFSIVRDINVDKHGIVWVLDNGVSRFDFKSIDNSKPTPLQIKNIKLNNEDIIWSSLQEGAFPMEIRDSLKAMNEMALKFGEAFSDEDFSVMSDAFGNVSYDSVAGSDFIPVNLVLPFKNNTIGFEFGSISTSFVKAVQYQYRLDGYDKNWSELSTKTEASYRNLSEGNYTFYIKALNPLGSWSEVSYSFKVLPPWYRTWWAYTLYGIFFLLGIRRVHVFQKARTIRKERERTQKRELEQAREIEKAYTDLKSAQAQLIQSEKMASLGELTAGIAHEIQNPLNFVNNFSEVNMELIAELKEELEAGNLEDIKAIADDIAVNEEKILQHGKRADAIVKGMLQHSRSSNGVKEPTDINALADEYLRLAYHGLRAKDKSFNAELKTDFDNSIGSIHIIPQDIGRVILNLITNAFYVVDEKKNSGIEGYEPTVSVSTKKEGNKVMISLKDNGNGIPEKVLDKIFQPFFTTKPTGQGTGLGLSLAYDIVKAHGGDLIVATIEGEGTSFTIQLPL